MSTVLAAAPRSSTPPSSPANAAAPADPATLVELLAHSVARFSARELFLEKRAGAWVAMTYAEFARDVGHVRGGLAALGVKPGDRVGIIAGNRSEWAVIAYAAYGLGAALVPMYETQRPRDWAFIARDAGISVLFVASTDIRDRFMAAGTRGEDAAAGAAPRNVIVLGGLSWSDLRAAGARATVLPMQAAPSSTACLMYTSGTTGDPKGGVLSHANIVSNVLGLRCKIPLETRHRTLSFLPWAHALGHTVELHMLIASGASTGIAESVEQLAANLVEVRPTVLLAVPRVFQRIYAGVEKLMLSKPRPVRWLYRTGLRVARQRAQGEPLTARSRALLGLCDRIVFRKIRQRFGGRLAFAVSGAAALEREVAEFIEALGIPVYEGYGLTETSPVVTANVPGAQKLGSVGRPLPDVRIVIDRSVTSASSGLGRDGEIVVHGPNVMVGYHNRPEETRAMFTPDGGLRTGDLGYLDEDGYLHITGRIKELYKLANGKYVAPAPLEERLKLSPLIANVMIYGDNRPCNVALVVPDAASARALCAEIGASDPFAGEGARFLRTRLSDEIARLSAEWKGYERVRAFALVEQDFTVAAGFLTPSLKLRRRNVLERYGDVLADLYRSADLGDADAG
jgi:long-chain acyl-CoA synthetase